MLPNIIYIRKYTVRQTQHGCKEAKCAIRTNEFHYAHCRTHRPQLCAIGVCVSVAHLSLPLTHILSSQIESGFFSLSVSVELEEGICD